MIEESPAMNAEPVRLGAISPEDDPEPEFWHSLVRVVGVSGIDDERIVEAVIPGWDPARRIQFPASILPDDVRAGLAPGVRILADVNLGEMDPEKLRMRGFRLAPPPIDLPSLPPWPQTVLLSPETVRLDTPGPTSNGPPAWVPPGEVAGDFGLDTGATSPFLGGPGAAFIGIPPVLVGGYFAEGSAFSESHSQDGTLRAVLRSTPAGRLVLEGDVEATTGPSMLLRYSVQDGSGDEWYRGYIGLHPVDNGTRRFGQVTLDPQLRGRWSLDCRIEVRPLPSGSLTTEDRADLERSIAAAGDEESRRVLAEALAGLPGAQP
jgi:hypothetical protein